MKMVHELRRRVAVLEIQAARLKSERDVLRSVSVSAIGEGLTTNVVAKAQQSA